MPKVRPLEVKALLPLLEQDWDTPEELAEALIQELDKVRTSRTSYVAAVQFGRSIIGVGVYPGARSAANAVVRQLETYGNLVSKGGVIAIETPEGFEKRLKELDVPVVRKSA